MRLVKVAVNLCLVPADKETVEKVIINLDIQDISFVRILKHTEITFIIVGKQNEALR